MIFIACLLFFYSVSFNADQQLKSKVIRNIVRLLLSIDPPNIIEAEKLMQEEHCLELSQGSMSRCTILFKMKISLLRGLPEEALRLAKFLLSEDQPILRIEADVEIISSLLEMDIKKQLPDLGFAGKLNIWAGSCALLLKNISFFFIVSPHLMRIRSFSRVEIQLQHYLRRWTSFFDFSAYKFHLQFHRSKQDDLP